MDFEIILAHLNVLNMSALFLIAFTFMGVFDGLYFHVLKFKLHRQPSAKLEHKIHAARGLLLGPIIGIVFVFNAGSYLLWFGIILIIIDTILEFFDILEEKRARILLGGVPSAETVLHIMATAARVTAITLILGNKPAEAYLLSSPNLLPELYPLFLRVTGTCISIGAMVGTLFQLFTMFAAYLAKSSNGTDISNEGLPFKEYNILHLYIGIPFALLFEGFSKILRATIKGTIFGLENLPNNAILYSFHKDALLTLTTKEIISIPKLAYIGYHGFGSYVPTYYYNSLGIKAIRYKFNQKEKPKDSIIRQMKSWEGIVIIRTDSGKPYGHVRASLIDLSKATGRPLVPIIQKANKHITLFEHIIPLPYAHVTTIIGKPISIAELEAKPREEARSFLQEKINNLSMFENKLFCNS